MSAGTRTSSEGEREERHRAELDAMREEFHRELSRRAFRIGELEEELERVTLKYETSLSWRITRPVRAARALLAAARRR